MSLEINLAHEIQESYEKFKSTNSTDVATSKQYATPGSCVLTGTDKYMRGHGTFKDGDEFVASVAGIVEQVNKLVCVKPLKTRYNGEVGDVVVGRITEVQQRRWKVEINGRLDAVLQLSSVNLPGGEQRRKQQEDELMMRHYLREGDLISAEVQTVYHDGSLSLHTRSLKYGKLGQGIMVKVSPSVVKRRKSHFHNLPCGAGVILGCNGYVWITTNVNEDDSTGGFVQNLETIARADREKMVRLKNCIELLASQRILLYDTTIMHAYEASQEINDKRKSTTSGYEPKELLKTDVMLEIAKEVRDRIARAEGR